MQVIDRMPTDLIAVSLNRLDLGQRQASLEADEAAGNEEKCGAEPTSVVH